MYQPGVARVLGGRVKLHTFCLQVGWGKCSEAFMLNGGFCKTSCGHCNTPAPAAACTDVPPNSQYTCAQQVNPAI